MDYEMNVAVDAMIEATREAIRTGDTMALEAIKAGTEKIQKLAEERHGPDWHKGLPQNDPF